MEKIKENFQPLVSIIIPVYNGANYLWEAIDSALAQTYKNIEIIIVNDGSDDDGETEKIALSYGNKIKYYLKENGGVATALNLAIQKAEGEYVSWLSHDDLYYPDKIESQINYLSNQEDKKAVIFGDVTLISHSGEKLSDRKISEKCKRSLKCLLAIDLDYTLNGCTMLFPKEIFNEIGMFDVNLKYTQDYSMWFNILRKGIPFLYLDKVFVLSRQHDSQGGKLNPGKATAESDQLHSDFLLEITDNEVDTYCEYSINFLIKIYLIYRDSGYLKTSFRLLQHITRLAISQKKEDEILKTFDEAIFSFNDSSKVKTRLKFEISKFFIEKKNRKRLLIYSNVWTRGGVERVMSIILNDLVEYFDIILVSGDKKFEKKFELDSRITHIKISESNDENIAKRLAAMSVLLEIDLFIGNPNIISNFLDIYEILHDLKIKSIACNHGYYFLPFHYSWLHSVLQKRTDAFKFANAVTWLTSFGVGIYSQYGENCAYMPNPNTFDERSDAASVVKDEKIVLCVGRFYDSIKRLDRALLVFSDVLKKCPKAKLVLVGDYNLEMNIPGEMNITFRNFLKNLNIPAQSISFEGEHEDMQKYYEKASLLILTSDSEGFGMALIEAGVFGLPCIVFDIPGIEDIIIDGENGFIVSQDDIIGMSKKVSTILLDNKLRDLMGEKSRAISRKFDKDIICLRWKKLIDSLLFIDDQVEINKMLKNDFSVTIDDQQKFIKRAIIEYEKNIRLLLDNVNSENGKIINKEFNFEGFRDKIKAVIKDFIFKKYKVKEKIYIKKLKKIPVTSLVVVTPYLWIKSIIKWAVWK